MKERKEKSIHEGREEISEILGVFAFAWLEGKDIISLRREDYQSEDFRRAGLHLEVGREKQVDRHLYIAEVNDNSQIFVIQGKMRPDEPYQLAWQGVDLRKNSAVGFRCGHGMATEVNLAHKGINNIYGDDANPDKILEDIRYLMGKLVNTEKYSPE